MSKTKLPTFTNFDQGEPEIYGENSAQDASINNARTNENQDASIDDAQIKNQDPLMDEAQTENQDLSINNAYGTVKLKQEEMKMGEADDDLSIFMDRREWSQDGSGESPDRL